jgi:hypothetical protein
MSPEEEKELKNKVRAREIASDGFGFAIGWFDEKKNCNELVDEEEYWRHILKLAKEKAPQEETKPPEPEQAKPMTDGDAREFEETLMPFGDNIGKPIKHVRLSYLCWLADQRFIDRLRRYLKSPSVQREIDQQ